MIKSKRINDIKITPVVQGPPDDPKKIRGYNYFKDPYCNVALIARKNSGKSTVIFNALDKCATKGTNVMIFSPTCNMDPTYKKMKEMLKKKGANVKCFEHFIDSDSGVNILNELLNMLQAQAKAKEEAEIQKEIEKRMPKAKIVKPRIPVPIVNFPPSKIEEEEIKEVKVKKDSKITPEYIFVIDDCSSDCVNPAITKLLTKNRHYKCKVFIAIHNVTNLHPSGLRMIDNLLLFPNINNDKIEEVAKKCDISFMNDNKKNSMLQNMYDFCTSKPYNFLYIDKGRHEFRKNFNEEIIVD